MADLVFEMGVSAASDVWALEQLAQQVSDWRKLTAFLNANGHFYDAGGKQKRYPQSQQRNIIERNMRGGMADFRLTPKTRERILSIEG